jgi:hypothetical protein
VSVFHETQYEAILVEIHGNDMNYINVQSFKWHVYAMARGLKLIPNVEYLFLLLDDKELLTGQYCPVCVLKVMVIPTLLVCFYHYISLWHVLMFVCMPS